MATLTVSLPDDLSAFVESQLALSGHASASDYLAALLLAERQRLARRELEAKILEGLAGPMIPVDDAFWDSIREQALERVAGEVIRP